MVAGSSGSGSVSTAAVSQAIAQATAQAIASAVANATGGNSAATAAASASSLQTDIQTALSSAAGQASFTGACTEKWNFVQPKQLLSPIAPKACPDGEFASSDIPESFSPLRVRAGPGQASSNSTAVATAVAQAVANALVSAFAAVSGDCRDYGDYRLPDVSMPACQCDRLT